MVDHLLYPFKSKVLDRNGLDYHYLDEGEGEPVVMVHGNPTWSFYYRNLIDALRSQYRTVAPDHIGCGLSDKPGDDRYEYTLKSRVDDLEALLESLDLTQKITLVLHDWGGMIGMAYAVRYPDRVKRLVILNTAAFFPPKEKPLPLALWLGRNTALGSFLIRGLNVFCLSAAWVGCKQNPLPLALRRAYIEPYNSWANRVAVLRFVQDIPLDPDDPAYEVVAEVERNLKRFQKTPMLICWGERDFVFTTEFLDEWTDRFPQAQVHRFPNAGHYILEDAAVELIPLIKNFIGTRST